MSRPAFWRVYYGTLYFDFTERSKARGFAIIRKSQGDQVSITPMGY